MREIKFRKWYLGEMDYSPGIWADGEGQVLVNHYFESEDEGRWMQYTGLKDKNGVEIYEGDILDLGSNFKPCTVVWQGVGFIGVQSKYQTVSLTGFHKASEIIGNIYEHPHLLEQEAPS